MRFKWLELPEFHSNDIVRFGTYGVILGATSFITGVVEKGDHYLEQFGYAFEKLILYLTSLGLGTCWIGGTFNRSQFARAAHLEKDELLPAITPVGYPSWARGPIDVIFKPIPGRLRFSWKKIFFHLDLRHPLNKASAGSYAVPLEMVRIAPSAVNRQPWRVVKDGGRYHFLCAHNAIYHGKASFDMQKIDLGIAMCHFSETAMELGLAGKWLVKKSLPIDLPRKLEYIATWIVN